MFNLQHEIDERAHKARTMKDIIEKSQKESRPTTPEENALFDSLEKDVKAHDVRIAEIQEHEKRAQASQDLMNRLNQPAGPSFKPAEPQNTTTQPGSPSSLIRVPATARRTSVLKAFKPQNGESHAECELRAYKAGMWVRAALFRDNRAQHWCLNHMGVDIRNAMITTSNPDGGYLVPDEMSRAIIDLREEYGVFRREARVWPMGSDTLLIPKRAGGVTISLVGEAQAIGQSSPTFGQVQLVAKKFGGLCLISSEIAEDAVIDVADWIANEFAYAFALFEDQAGFIGDGTSTYGGMRGLGNYYTPTGGAGGGQLVGAVDAASGHDTFAEIDNADLTTLMGRLPAYALPGAKWYCSAVCAQVVFNRLAAIAGGNNTQTLREGVGLSYLGYPIVISQVLPTSTGDLSDLPMLYFGDLSKAAQMGDRRSIEVFVSAHRYMDTDQIAIRGTERVDVVISELGDTTTGVAGPLVALLGE